jgi:ADP-ribose pyrophosphatase
MSRRFAGYDVISDERLHEGGFINIRRVRLRVRRDDGSLSNEGLYDFIERPMGRDAVVVVLWHRAPQVEGEGEREGGGVQVLLRTAPRLPLWFRDPAIGAQFVEVVAGILEKGEDDWPAIQRRAAAEAHEEAGITVAPESVQLLGPPGFPTPGMFAERFFFVSAEVSDPSAAIVPPTDGSPFEEGATVAWHSLAAALRQCEAGAIPDLKTELALRRLCSTLG